VLAHDAGNLVFALSAAVDGVLVCAAVWWSLRGDRILRRALAAASVVAALLAVKGIVLVSRGLDVPFGVMHVLWLDMVVVLPLAGVLALVLLGRRPGAAAARVVAVGACLLAPVGAYAALVEPERLVVERAEVGLPAGRGGSEPLRVGVLTDLQFSRLGHHERKAVDRLMAERPDLILLAGDYHQGSRAILHEELPGLRRLLSRLDAPGGVYAVHGDCEGVEEARLVLSGTGVRLLVNDTARTRARGRTISIAGLERDYWSPHAQRLIRTFERAPGERDVRILLSHRPDAIDALSPRSRVDLVVAGHTHGGQVQLPFYGPPSTASGLPRAVAAGGLHDLDGRSIYVSRGVGAERGQAPRLRLGAPPEVAVVTLR
jgi:predicted MPP superfamily phosphohydrolase